MSECKHLWKEEGMAVRCLRCGDRYQRPETDAEIITQLQTKLDRYKTALIHIKNWNFPPSGHKWESGLSMSYGAAFGSNGERDYMIGLAEKALEKNDART
jgi:hypothetical protein